MQTSEWLRVQVFQGHYDTDLIQGVIITEIDEKMTHLG